MKVPKVSRSSLILDIHGGVIGQSRIISIDKLIYVVPSKYAKLPEKKRYAVARIIGELMQSLGRDKQEALFLVGPGRWGTTTASLGIPVSFAEINSAAAICEIDVMHEGLVTDLSLGTHFFGDLVELNMLYLAFHTSGKGNFLNEALILKARNRLSSFLPEHRSWSDVIRVIEKITPRGSSRLTLNADSVKQRAVLYNDKS